MSAVFFLMHRQPPESTRTYTLVPYPPLFRSIGLIRFGSRVDVYLPKGTAPRVVLGQRSVAGETVLAKLGDPTPLTGRSEEHTSELQSLMRISYAVFCLKTKNTSKKNLRRHAQTETIQQYTTQAIRQ